MLLQQCTVGSWHEAAEALPQLEAAEGSFGGRIRALMGITTHRATGIVRNPSRSQRALW